MRRLSWFVVALMSWLFIIALAQTSLPSKCWAIDGSNPRERFRVPGDPAFGDPDGPGGGSLVSIDKTLLLIPCYWGVFMGPIDETPRSQFTKTRATSIRLWRPFGVIGRRGD